MKTKKTALLAEARIVDRPELRIAGLRRHFTSESRDEIPLLWQQLMTEVAAARAHGFTPASSVAYGVCFCSTGEHGFEYLAGVPVNEFRDVPPKWHHVTLPAHSYAVFTHEGHVSEIADTAAQIEGWHPPQGYECIAGSAARPNFFERYGERFAPDTGTGDMEIWVPIRQSLLADG